MNRVIILSENKVKPVNFNLMFRLRIIQKYARLSLLKNEFLYHLQTSNVFQ